MGKVISFQFDVSRIDAYSGRGYVSYKSYHTLNLDLIQNVFHVLK